jgi:hypothetical protein
MFSVSGGGGGVGAEKNNDESNKYQNKESLWLD